MEGYIRYEINQDRKRFYKTKRNLNAESMSRKSTFIDVNLCQEKPDLLDEMHLRFSSSPRVQPDEMILQMTKWMTMNYNVQSTGYLHLKR